MDQMFQQQRSSLGLGSTGQMGNGAQFNPQMQMLQQQQRMMPEDGGDGGGVGMLGMPGGVGPGGNSDQDTLAMQNRLNQLKEDIARREQENMKLGAGQATDLGGSGDGSKRDGEGGLEAQMNKRQKVDGEDDEE
jgi:hypothetical protein